MPQLPLNNERVEEAPDSFGSIGRQANRAQDVVHADGCPANALVEDPGKVGLDGSPEDGERSLTLKRRRRGVDRLETGFDGELAEFLADRKIVRDQLVDRDTELVKDPLRGQIQGDDPSIDAPEAPTDLERAYAAD